MQSDRSTSSGQNQVKLAKIVKKDLKQSSETNKISNLSFVNSNQDIIAPFKKSPRK